MQAGPDPLDGLGWQTGPCTRGDWEAEELRCDEEDIDVEQEEAGKTSTGVVVETSKEQRRRHDFAVQDAVVEIHNTSTDNDVDVLCNQNKRLLCVGANTDPHPIRLPHNIRHFYLRNSKSGHVTDALPFNDANSSLRVEDWRSGSYELRLLNKAGDLVLQF